MCRLGVRVQVWGSCAGLGLMCRFGGSCVVCVFVCVCVCVLLLVCAGFRVICRLDGTHVCRFRARVQVFGVHVQAQGSCASLGLICKLEIHV